MSNQIFLSITDTSDNRNNPLVERIEVITAESVKYEMTLPASVTPVDLFPGMLSSVSHVLITSDVGIEIRLNGAVSGYTVTAFFLAGAAITGIEVVAVTGATLKIVLMGALG